MSPLDRLTQDSLDGLIIEDQYEAEKKMIAKAEKQAENDLVQEQEKWS